MAYVHPATLEVIDPDVIDIKRHRVWQRVQGVDLGEPLQEVADRCFRATVTFDNANTVLSDIDEVDMATRHLVQEV